MVAGLSVGVLWLVTVLVAVGVVSSLEVTSLVVSGLVVDVLAVDVLVGVVSWLVVNVLVLDVMVLVAGDHCVVFVVDGTSVGFVLKFDVGLLLVVLLVVRVEVGWHLVVDGVVMDDAWLIVVLVMGHALNEVVGLLVVVLVVTVFAVVVVMVVIMVVEALIVVSVVFVHVVGSSLVNWGLVDGSSVMNGSLVDSSGVMSGGVVVTEVVLATVHVLLVGVVALSVVEGLVLATVGEGVKRDLVLHLSAEEDLGERKTNRVAVLIEVLVLPLGLSVHDLVVDVLSVDNEVVLNMEDEVPWVSESLGHLTELVEVGADGGLALFELVGNVMDDVAKILDSVEHAVEGAMLKLVLNTTKTLPDVLSIAEALNTVRNLSFDGAGKETLKDLAHAEEGEVHVGALHGLEVVHLLVLLVIDLIEELLPVVIKVVEELFVVDHLGLSVKKHGGGLAEVLTTVEPLAHAVVMETLTGVLKDVDTVDDERLGGLEQDLLGVEEGLSHSLDLLVVVMVNLTAMVEHVANVGHGQTELVNGLGGLLVGSIPEAAHRVLEVLLNWVGIGDAVADIGHAVEVESTNKEAFNKSGDLGVVVGVVSVGCSNDKSGSECLEHLVLKWKKV